MQKVIILLVMVFLLQGCMTSEQRDAENKIYGERRHKIFVECMELAAKMPRQADDDVSDIVDACGSQSNYLASSY